MEEPQIQEGTEADFWAAFDDLIRSAPADLVNAMPEKDASQVFALQKEISKREELEGKMLAYAKEQISLIKLSDNCIHCQNYSSLSETNKIFYLGGFATLSGRCEHITPYSDE